MFDMPCFIKIKKINPVENRSNFLRSERLQFFAYFISCTDAQRSSQIHLRCLWDEITESWRIMVSFMLSLSCKDTIVIIKRKLSRTKLFMDIRMKWTFVWTFVWNYLAHYVKVINMNVNMNGIERKDESYKENILI